eukprot:jgi/Astpho2/4495/e_gw1.00067.112.1_t
MKVQVKWQKNTYDVEIDQDQPPSIFKQQMFSLTGVPAERQKISVKGGMLKDDADWHKLGIKPGAKLMMMGTADKVPEAPTTAQVFLEDLPEDEQDITGLAKYGAGLQNLGNTCYMNSTLQCLYRIPELRTALQTYPEGGATSVTMAQQGAHKLTVAAKGLFGDLRRSAQPVHPFRFLLMLREAFPQFAQQGREGHYSQQDAEECWSQLVYTLRGQLKEGEGDANSIIQKTMGIGFHTRLTNEESQETIEEDTVGYTLKCNINMEVNHLTEGIKLGLKDDREKHSAQLNRTVVFAGSSAISRLPPYLTVQMVRFYYKADVQQKAKILRKVVFPLVLDTYELCTDAYKRDLDGPREALTAEEDRKAGLEKAAKRAKQVHTYRAQACNSLDGAGWQSCRRLQSVLGNGIAGRAGSYELCAVLTHKGRSADSGHYVSWVKQDDGSWIQFDDDQLIPRKEEEIPSLSGGGDWHMAYLLLYRAQHA